MGGAPGDEFCKRKVAERLQLQRLQLSQIGKDILENGGSFSSKLDLNSGRLANPVG